MLSINHCNWICKSNYNWSVEGHIGAAHYAHEAVHLRMKKVGRNKLTAFTLEQLEKIPSDLILTSVRA